MRLPTLTFVLIVSALAALRPAHAETPVNPSLYIVTYFEVGAPAAAETAALARHYVAAARKAAGNAGFDAFEEIGRPGRFVLLEAWRDKAAAEGNAAAAAGFAGKVQSLLVSPFDSRQSTPLSVAPASGHPGPGVVYVLTHVDVVPTNKDRAIELVKALAADGRKDPGNLAFDVLQQDSRPNHFTLVEIWRDRKAQEGSAMAPHTREFRTQLTPLSGSLYDERLYHALH
jgi:quinol monooxygenase YgiN